MKRHMMTALILVAVTTTWLGLQAYAATTTVVKNPAAGTPEATVTAAFQAALKGDFKAYLQTIHPDERATIQQKIQLERYSWARFKKQARRYLITADPVSYAVVRRQEESGGVKLFIKDQTQAERMPVPVRLAKGPGGWGITSNSL